MNQPDPQRRIAGGVEYELTRRRVRNLNIRVRTDGSVAVSAPRQVPLSSVDAFVAARADWVRAAQQRAAEITAAAQSESRTLRQTVTDYCDNMLKTTEEAMVENAAQVKNVRANLRQNAKKNG